MPVAPTASRPAGRLRSRPDLLDRLGIPYMDLSMVAAAIGLPAFSILVLAATMQGDIPGDPYFYAKRQSIYLLVGIVGMVALASFDYSRFRDLRIGVYTLMCVSISMVFAFGFSARGSQRSFELPFFNLQPSELGKVLLALSLSAFVLDGASRRRRGVKRTARWLAIGLFPAALVFMQPNLGTALVFGVITLVVIYLAGVHWTHMAAICSAIVVMITLALVVAPKVGVPGLQPYQVERLTSFLHPSQDPGDAGYQQNQAKIAIGSGEKTGRGDQATQTRLAFVPERHNDFIFAVVGERYGFMGAALVLSLYALLLWRALRLVTLSKNTYGSLIAGGIAAALLFQVFINVGMNLGIMPITGVPLPLMSFGGSSLISTMLAIGVLQSIHVQMRLSQGGR